MKGDWLVKAELKGLTEAEPVSDETQEKPDKKADEKAEKAA